jgi:phenylpyruvate tautomerase PptA (4-oxalocrotonate tautomerase family)
MPFYQVHHSYPLTDEQRNALASRITYIHTRLFTVPSAFVNVGYENVSATPYYIGGMEPPTFETLYRLSKVIQH